MGKLKYKPIPSIEEGSKSFMHAVRKRCAELDWSEARMAAEAGIPLATWTAISNYRKSPTIEVLVQATHVLGLKIDMRMQ